MTDRTERRNTSRPTVTSWLEHGRSHYAGACNFCNWWGVRTPHKQTAYGDATEHLRRAHPSAVQPTGDTDHG